MKNIARRRPQTERDGHVTTPQEMGSTRAERQASKTAVDTVPAGADVYSNGNKLGVRP